jgi:hypothetical protein
MPISQIVTNSIANGAVVEVDIADGAVTNAKINTMAASKLTGQAARANMPAGSVLQAVQVFKTDTSTMSVSSFTDIPGMEVQITPISTSSRILVMTSVQATAYQQVVQLRITRNGTAVGIANAAGSRVQTLIGGYYNSLDQNHQNNPFASYFLDSPASTSALTYRIQLKTQDGGATQINRSGNDADNSNWSMRSTSNITLLEIAG